MLDEKVNIYIITGGGFQTGSGCGNYSACHSRDRDMGNLSMLIFIVDTGRGECRDSVRVIPRCEILFYIQ